MVNVTIDQLLDGEEITTSDDPVATQSGGVTYRTTNRKNPEGQITIRNQTQLEDKLGATLEIPDSESRTIAIDNSLTLDESIKLGLNSALNISASATNNTITNITSKFFENTDLADAIAEIALKNLTLIGDTTKDAFDIIGNAMSAITCDEVIFQNLNFVGIIDTGAALFTGCSMRNITQGIILKNQVLGRIDRFSIGQPAANGMTAFAFIPGVNPLNVTIDTVQAQQFAAGNSLFFIDPNSPAGSRYSIINSDSGLGDFFQQGTDIPATATAASGSNTEFNITAHGLVEGKYTVLKNFTGFTGYNITVKTITVIDPDNVVLEVGFLGVDATGTMNSASLDSTSVLVFTDNNEGTPDSMSQAEARTGATLEVDGSGGVDVPIVDVAPVPGNWIQDPNTQDFIINTTTGEKIYIGIKTKTFRMEYQLTATPTSGPPQILDFDIHINGIAQTKTTTTIDTANVTKTTYIGGLFVLSTGDAIQVHKENLSNTNNTNVSVATVLTT